MHEPYDVPEWNIPHPPQETAALWQLPDHGQHTPMAQQPAGHGEMNGAWDPAEELAFLLQQAAIPRQAESFDRVGFDQSPDTVSVADPTPAPPNTATRKPNAQAPNGHRRTPPTTPAITLARTSSVCTALLVAVIAAVVSIFSGLAICDALRHSAAPHTAHDVVNWWPLLIYGPWMAASLSILRAALHQRRALHSWSIVLLFSILATLLCVAQAPRTLTAQAAATLPAIAALACFQQLVRQITLTRPPRQPAPRHRASFPFRRPAAVTSNPGATLPAYPKPDHHAGPPPAPGFHYGA